jgi:hypothetical protein
VYWSGGGRAGGGSSSIGGGGGGRPTSTKAADGQKHTGGGGGGSGYDANNSSVLGGNGGSGVVILKSAVGAIPQIVFDNYNKITLENTNYEDTATVSDPNGSIHEIGTAKTMYVKDAGEYVFKISGTDKYVDSNVYVSSVDLAGAPTKPIDFDGYNKLTLIDAGSNVSANVTYFSNTYELGSANVLYINGAGTYDLEMSGSNVFALSSNVVGTVSQQHPTDVVPSLTFDNYNKLTLENFTTSESDTRTATLTVPNGNTYSLGQTQNDIYIEDTGDYILEVTNSDQSAVVTKNVGSVSQHLTDVVPSLTFDGYNKLSIENLTPTSTRLTYGSNTYDIGTASNVYIEDAGTYKFATGDANTFALVSNVVGTVSQHPEDVVPSLTYDTSNKLSIENLTPTSTTLTDPNGSSFDIGTASNVYIRDSGTYSIASKDANTFVLASNTVTGTPTGTTYVYDSNTFTTPSQTYDTTKTITVSNVPSTLTDVVGNIYKGSTAYTIHATTSSSNVIIKNMGTYVSVFTTATQAFLTNAVNVNATPESDDNTIEDAAPLATTTTTTSTSTSIDITLAFHYGSFDTVYGDVDVTEAANNGHIFDDTPEGTYDWGTLDSTPSTASNQTTYTWTPSGTITADVLMVAGGGGGGGESSGGNSPGGGGGGGIVFIQNQNISEQQTIIVGDGGPGGSGSVNGSFGGDSSAFGTSAWGGGGGAKGDGNAEAPINNGQYGGGGGGSGNGNSGGAPATVQGNKGGNGPGVDGSSDGLLAGGGGGGNVQGGGNGGNGGDGGNYLSIFGTLYGENGVFSGGGAGGNANNGNTLRYGGSGGGGNGGNSNQGGSGQAHTGGGGAASWGASGTNSGGRGGSGIVLLKFIEIITTTTTTTGGIAGSTAVPTETTTDAPSVTLDATDTTVTDPTLDLDFTTTLPRTLKRYNNITSSSIGARFNRRESRKKRIEKSINADTFSIELTANNASSPTTLTVTVANSKFVINGDETPTLGFIRGETYTFDQSDVSNSGHPLVLVTSEDGATQYTTGWTASGTPGTDGSHAFIVPYDVPDTIYYKCTNHSNMGGEINTTFGNVFSLGDFTVAANTHVSGEYTLATNYDGTTSNLYVNGSLITQTTPSPAISAGIKDFILGKEFDGYVKNFTFWNYITVSPTITLSGDNPQSISGSYTELGASAVDQFGNSVSVVIDSSNVDTATAGTYYVTYTATGTNGVRGSVTRQVVVLAQVDQTFSYTGSLQTWTAPADMTVQVQMKGGSGGGWSFTPPGIGGWITFDINVIGGRTYDVVVGGNGASVSGGDSTKGGSGGGASGFGYNGTWYAIAGGGGGQDSAKTQNRNGGVPFSWNGQGSNGGTTTAARGNASGHNGGNGGNGSRAGGYGVGTGGGGSSGNSYGGGGGGWFGGGGGRPSSGGSTYYDSNYVDLSTIVATQPSVQFKITNVNKLT